MSKAFNIDEARDLFAKTGYVECFVRNRSCIFQGVKKVADTNHDQCQLNEVLAWAEFIAAAHKNWLAMLNEIGRLRETVAKQQSELGEYCRERLCDVLKGCA